MPGGSWKTGITSSLSGVTSCASPGSEENSRVYLSLFYVIKEENPVKGFVGHWKLWTANTY